MPSKEYIIAAVSEKVKNWDSKYGPMVTYYIRLEGEGEDAVQLNKKSDSPIPKVGDELYGDVQETEYGPKFKSQKRSQMTDNGQTQEHIARSVALKASVDYWAIGAAENTGTEEEVLGTADTFLAWLQGKSASQSEPKREWTSLGKDKPIEDIGDEPINLDDIPF